MRARVRSVISALIRATGPRVAAKRRGIRRGGGKRPGSGSAGYAGNCETRQKPRGRPHVRSAAKTAWRSHRRRRGLPASISTTWSALESTVPQPPLPRPMAEKSASARPRSWVDDAALAFHVSPLAERQSCPRGRSFADTVGLEILGRSFNTVFTSSGWFISSCGRTAF